MKRGKRPEVVRCGDCVFFIPDYYGGKGKRGGCQATPPGFGVGLGPDDGCGMFAHTWGEPFNPMHGSIVAGEDLKQGDLVHVEMVGGEWYWMKTGGG